MALPETVDADAIYRGDGWAWPVEFFTDEALTDPVDLTAFGATWASQARSGSEVLDIEVDSSDAATGRLVLRLTHEQTAPILHDALFYDVQATPVDGEPVTLIRGDIVVAGEVTK